MGKRVALLLIVALAVSSLLMINFASASTDIPEPYVPEFTVEFVNGSLELRIENQPLASYRGMVNDVDILFYYNVQAKMPSSDQWLGFYKIDDGEKLLAPSDSEYTVVHVGALTSNGLHLRTISESPDFPFGDKVDFRVEARIGHFHWRPSMPVSFYYFSGEYSGWSSIQTITVPVPSPTPTPVSETLKPVAMVLGVIIALVISTVLLSIYKRNKPKQKQAKLSRWQ